ncbi:hypothetical protein GQ457_11G027530 [Hibiscus cannabinus]
MIREVAAYLLDYGHFSNVPHTILVKVSHSVFNINDGVSRNKLKHKKVVSKIASLQQSIPHDFDAGEHGTSSFPVDAIHRIRILDIKIFNTNMHAGNLLVMKLGGVGGFGQNLDPLRDSDLLRAELPMAREACFRVLVVCSIFLQEAAAFGLCLAKIGEMMSREFHAQEEEPSELKLVCLEAKELLMEIHLPFFEADERDDELQFDMDCKKYEVNVIPKTTENLSVKAPFWCQSISMNDRNFLAQLDENIEVSNIQVDEGPVRSGISGLHCHGRKPERTCTAGDSSRMIRTAYEQLPTLTSFVKFADMNEEEWTLFIVQFKELFHPAFAN